MRQNAFRDRKLFITPLLVALCVIEVSDVIFAVDSIPAIFGITQDPFIVFTSNIFAILGLRSLYFVLASILEKFSLLKYSVGAILLFVSFKLLVPAGYYIYDLVQGTIDPKTGAPLAFDWGNLHPISEPFIEDWPTWSNLAVIGGLIFVGIVGSLIRDKMQSSNEANSDVAAVAEEVKETTSDAVSEDVKSSTEVAE